MINLERHIETLLLDNDCVIVPQFGGFMAHHISSYYDEKENLYFPPRRSLGFNKKLHINDSLLVQSYVEAYSLSYPDALNMIEQEVEELKQQLKVEGYYEFSNLGVLSMTDTGVYDFAPCESGLSSPSLYGLNVLSINGVAVEKQINKAEEKTLLPIEQYLPETEKKSAEQEKDDVLVIKKSSLRTAMLAAASVIIAFLIALPLNNQGNGGLVTCSFSPASLKEFVAFPLKKSNNEADTQNTSTAEIKTTKKSAVIEETSDYYTIVVAAKITEKNGKAFEEQLISKGEKDVKLLMDNPKNIKLVCGRYNSENDALSALNSKNKNKEFADAWIMHVK